MFEVQHYFFTIIIIILTNYGIVSSGLPSQNFPTLVDPSTSMGFRFAFSI